jgi:hypothetical protein
MLRHEPGRLASLLSDQPHPGPAVLGDDLNQGIGVTTVHILHSRGVPGEQLAGLRQSGARALVERLHLEHPIP